MKPTDPEYWVDRLQTQDERERFEVLRDWARAPNTLELAGDVARYLAALSKPAPAATQPVDDEALAVEVACGRVPHSALCDPWQLQLVLGSLAPESPTSVAPAGLETRAALEALLPPVPGVRPARGFGIVSSWAAVLATAAVLAGVLWTAPAGPDWARTIGLSRGAQLRLGTERLDDLRRFAETGTTAAAPFKPTGRSTRRERTNGLTSAPPRTLAPIWETVPHGLPNFSWTEVETLQGEQSYEFMLLSEARELVWKTTLGATQLRYPEDAPQLQPGETYHWKVNRIDGDHRAASAYASFRLLTEDERAALKQDLSRSSQPLVRALLLDHWGAYSAARGELVRLGSKHPQQTLAEQLDRAMRDKQAIP